MYDIKPVSFPALNLLVFKKLLVSKLMLVSSLDGVQIEVKSTYFDIIKETSSEFVIDTVSNKETKDFGVKFNMRKNDVYRENWVSNGEYDEEGFYFIRAQLNTPTEVESEDLTMRNEQRLKEKVMLQIKQRNKELKRMFYELEAQ